MSEAIDPNQSAGINQADYLKLFMQELTYQDPLKPIDNREFMAQMAQFSALQEAQATTSALGLLLGLESKNLGLMLLGKEVTLKATGEDGVVNRLEFSDDGPPIIHVQTKSGNPRVRLEDLDSAWIPSPLYKNL